VREHWSLDPGLVYLNHGSFGAVPRVTQHAQHGLQSEAEANPMRWFRDLPARLVDIRDTVGHFLGVTGDDVALVGNATSGINVALRSLRMVPGQRLVLTNHAYGGVLLAADRIAAERGCEVVLVDLALDAGDDEVLASLDGVVDETTAGVVIDQITSPTAKLMPVERVAELGRERGVSVIVDGAHAPGLVDDPVVGDMWTGNLHKWPCAPRGTGVLYVAPHRRTDVFTPVVSWGVDQGFPVAFDGPGTTDATGWVATPSALELLDTLAFADRRKDLGELVSVGAEVVAEAVGGAVVDVGTPAPTMRLVALPDGLVTDTAGALRLGAQLAATTGVEVAPQSWRGLGFLRLSAHLYNTPDDYTDAAAQFAPVFADSEVLAAIIRADL
jgi:isopenicillin-N epimerase